MSTGTQIPSPFASLRSRLLAFATTPDQEGADPRHTQHKADVREVFEVIDGYIKAVLDHEDVNAAYDTGMGLWPDHIQRAKKAEQDAYERLFALSTTHEEAVRG